MKDWHIHTWYSHDSLNPPRLLIREYERLGFDEILVCDHSTVRGSLKVKELANNIHVITGLEFKTAMGDLIGADITEDILERDPLEFIDQVHERGGFVILPHPYRSHILWTEVVQRVDYIEAFNGHTPFQLNIKALELARALDKPWTAGSDAHFPWDIGTVGFDDHHLIFRTIR